MTERQEELATVTAHAPRPAPEHTAPVAPVPGDVLADRFRVDRRLGEGGTGIVYEVTDLRTDASYALKALRAPRPRRMALLKAEFRAVRDLVHPRLVTVHELFVADGQAFMTMDRVDGEPLTTVARAAAAEGDWGRVRDLFGQCAAGVATLHDRGLLHRDLKPTNVLVDRTRGVQVLDFGLASAVPAAGIGTPAYMAPEQRRGDELLPATDVYGLGVMLFETLCAESANRVRATADRVARLRAADAPTELTELCARMIATEPSERPTTNEVLRALDPNAEPMAVARSRFVGRTTELSILRDELLASRTGLRSLLVRGPAGVGKSRLLREAIARFGGTVRVLQSHCSAYEHVAFNGFDGMVDGLVHAVDDEHWDQVPEAERHALGRLFPALAPLAAAAEPVARLPLEERETGFRGMALLLGALAREAPLVLAIDDVQWADADSLALLRSLLERDELEGLVVLCERTTVDGTPIRLPAHPRVLTLGPLDGPSLRELAAETLGVAQDDVTALRLARESEGSPLLVEQLAAWVEREGSAPALRRAVEARLAALPATERELLERIALHDDRLTLEEGLALTENPGAGVALKNLCVRRFCARTERHIDAHHGVIRELVRAALSPEDRRSHHRWLFGKLRERPEASPATLAAHAAGAGLRPEAFGYFVEAARGASETLAFHRAATLLREALELGPGAVDAAHEEEARELLADALFAAGRGAEAADEYLALAAGGGPKAPAHRCRAAEQLLVSGRTEAGQAVLQSLMKDLEIAVPSTTVGAVASLLTLRVRLRIERGTRGTPSPRALHRIDALAAGTSGSIMTDHVRGAWFAARQLLEAERAGDPVRIVRALVYEALYLANEGTANERAVRANIERARHHAERTDAVEAHALHALARGLSALLLGEWRAASAGLEEAERWLTHPECRRWWELTLSRKFRSITHWFIGDPATMAESIARWMADAERRNDEAAQRSFAAELPLVALVQDRPDDAWEHIQALEADLDPGVFDESRVVSLHNQLHHALYVDASPERLLELASAIQPLFRSLLGRSQLLRVTSRFYASQARLAASLARGGDEGLLRRVTKDAERLRGEGVGYAALYGDLLQSTVWAQRGESERARSLLTETAAGLEANGQRLYAAGARARLSARSGELEAAERMRELGVARPEHFGQVLAPGFATLAP